VASSRELDNLEITNGDMGEFITMLVLKGFIKYVALVDILLLTIVK
jgi:hypothetical protein